MCPKSNMGFLDYAALGFLLLFVGLKLSGILTWSWWLVLSPLWFWFALWLAIVIFMFVMAMITMISIWFFSRRK